MNKLLVLTIITNCLLIIGCSTNNESIYLTPVTSATLSAYEKINTPVKSKLDAVITALLAIQTTRVVNIGDPTIVYVEKMEIAEAYKKVGRDELLGSLPKGKQVWLVIFEGEWQMIFPMPNEQGVTPPLSPPKHGCMFSIIDSDDGGSFGGGGISCQANIK